jgi:hypothetical protein
VILAYGAAAGISRIAEVLRVSRHAWRRPAAMVIVSTTTTVAKR